jgi:hypothetical protein
MEFGGFERPHRYEMLGKVVEPCVPKCQGLLEVMQSAGREDDFPLLEQML